MRSILRKTVRFHQQTAKRDPWKSTSKVYNSDGHHIGNCTPAGDFMSAVMPRRKIALVCMAVLVNGDANLLTRKQHREFIASIRWLRLN